MARTANSTAVDQTPGRIARSLSALTGGTPRPKWPNPEVSVGTFCGMMKRYKCWDATGRVQKLFVEISPKINELLSTTCPPVPKNGVIGYGIFMIGTAPETSVPHIMFACTLPGPRKQALQELRKSGIIETYAPGFHTGHWRNPPHIDDPEFLFNCNTITESDSDGDGDSDSDSDSSSEDEPAISPKHLWTVEVVAPNDSNDTPVSSRIQFRRPCDPFAAPLSATTGGVVCISQRLFLFTVAHVLPKPEASDDQPIIDTFVDNIPYVESNTDGKTNTNNDSDTESQINGDTDNGTDSNAEDDAESETDNSETDGFVDTSDDEFEFGGFESSSTDATDHEVSSNTSDSSDSGRGLAVQGDIQRTPYQATEVFLSAVDGCVRELNEQKDARTLLDQGPLRPTHGEPPSLSLIIDASNVMGSLELDYMLIPVELSVSASWILGLPTLNHRDACPIPHVNTHVQTSTSSGGSVNGILWGSSSFICIKGTSSFQRVWPVSLGSPLQPGDSGSCVFDATTKAFYGHIVAGSTSSRIAYVVSAREVFNDIEERLTPLVQPSSSVHHPSRAQKAQPSLVDDDPGVEDASVVFEVHATAEKYVPKNNDSNGENSKQRRLPWETECMGFVRLVKNNSTGEVRLQLHSEPRATLVLDQPLDSDYTYREEPWGPKSVRISVATDKGKDSETWRIITKGSSRALADALEEHKMANAAKDG